MIRQTTCPDPVRLRGLLDGHLASSEESALTEHLDSCERCQHLLDELSGGEPSWSRSATQVGPTTPPSNSAYWKALKQVEDGATRGDTPSEATGEDVTLDFLSPSDKPGHLGRLDHFEVIEVIGRGGMGVVLRAFDPCLQRF